MNYKCTYNGWNHYCFNILKSTWDIKKLYSYGFRMERNISMLCEFPVTWFSSFQSIYFPPVFSHKKLAIEKQT